MASLRWLYSIFIGPRLFRILKHDNIQGKNYNSNMLENFSDKGIKMLRACWGVSWWTSPFLLATLYVRGYFSEDGALTVGKFCISLCIVYAAVSCLRGIGRLLNDDYMRFFRVLVQATELPTIENKRRLHHYDFEFWAWPVDFHSASESENKGVRVRHQKIQASAGTEPEMSVPVRLAGYVAMHLIGWRMVYPGATSIMHFLVGETLNQGRFLLLEEKGGRRAKILTEDSNEIDTMFVDRRHPASRHGNTLVVCFEGNAGYYEIGCCGAPIECGYSVLGWNHPGFAGSSGVPLPEAEQCAIDAVMQYAIHRIGFPLERIALFAWSIGGYSASWAAMNYPGVKHVVLDATFDDLVPLALSQMPDALSGLVRVAMLTHMNLNIADQLMWYPGPIKLIRRYRDEIIATEKTANNVPVLGSNRGNHLLVRLLCHRYPEIVNQSTLQELWNYLQDDRVSRVSVLQQEELSPAECEQRLGVYSSEVSTVYPMLIGEGYSPSEKISMTLFLASKYMVDFDATHCTPLPATFFTPAWSPSGDA